MGIWDDLASGTQSWVTRLLEESDKALEPVYNFPDGSMAEVKSGLLNFRYIMVYYFSEAIKFTEDVSRASKKLIEDKVSEITNYVEDIATVMSNEIDTKINDVSNGIRSFVDGAIKGVERSIDGVSDDFDKFSFTVDGAIADIKSRLRDIAEILFDPMSYIELLVANLEAVW